MKIDIIVDTICPWCYIGKKRFERALQFRPQPDLEVGWRAFQLNPDMPHGGMDRRLYVAQKFGGNERAKSVHRSLFRAGMDEGIRFAFERIERTPNTLDSHRLIRFAASQGLQTAVVGAVFDAYFLAGRDIGDHATLAEVAEGAGLDGEEVRDFLATDIDVETVKAEDDLARRLGVNGVPCFIIDRRYAVSGAQSPEVFVQVFDLANQEAQEIAAE